MALELLFVLPILVLQGNHHVMLTCNTYFVTASVHVIYLGVSGQCSHTIHVPQMFNGQW